MQTLNGRANGKLQENAQAELDRIYQRLDQLGMIEERKGLLTRKQEREYIKLAARELEILVRGE